MNRATGNSWRQIRAGLLEGTREAVRDFFLPTLWLVRQALSLAKGRRRMPSSLLVPVACPATPAPHRPISLIRRSHMERTSLTDPLRIAELPVGSNGGAVGVTFAPGKHQAQAMTGIWARDLDTDLLAIRDWGAQHLITLIEPQEFTELKIEALPDRARAHGLIWDWLPITDGAAPDHRLLGPWRMLGPALAERLHAGSRVVVHCKGGLGRAGSVAAMLLLDSRAVASADEAIARIRSVRPGAVETLEQEHFLHSLAWRPSARQVMSIDDQAPSTSGLPAAKESGLHPETHDRILEALKAYWDRRLAGLRAPDAEERLVRASTLPVRNRFQRKVGEHEAMETAHRRSYLNRAALEESSICGCFHCLATFPPGDIVQWIDGPMGAELTALCPRCGFDSVLGSASLPISADFLTRMRDYWFPTQP